MPNSRGRVAPPSATRAVVRGRLRAVALHRRTARAIGKQLALECLSVFFARLPDRLLLVPIGGGEPAPGELLRITCECSDRVAVLSVDGEIDLNNIAMLRTAFDRLDADTPLLIDLVRVRYLDGSTLHLLAAAGDRYRARGTPLAIVATGTVRRLCAVVALDARVPVFDEFTQARVYVEREGGTPPTSPAPS